MRPLYGDVKKGSGWESLGGTEKKNLGGDINLAP